MKFSIIIPTFKNFNYLILAIKSIKKNSSFKNEIIIHINGNDFKTENYLLRHKIKYTKSFKNIGLCSGVNLAAKLSSTNYIVYAHDDMYFLPKWDHYIGKEINKHNSKLFYFSSTQISNIPDKGGKDKANHIHFNAGENVKNFNEKKLLENYDKLKFYDLQGSHWAPHIVHKDIWDRIGGFSEEFDPGFGSDPDLNMKLWKVGVRVFKGINKSRIYHFGSLTTRKNKKIVRNDGAKTFLLKWGITINFFVKYYLLRGRIYKGELLKPKLTFLYLFDLIKCKIKFLFKFYGK